MNRPRCDVPPNLTLSLRRLTLVSVLAGHALAATVATPPVFQATFEAGVDDFTAVNGKVTVTQITASALSGQGSLRLELGGTGQEMARVASPEFAVQPLSVYRLTLKRQGARGLDARFFLELKQPTGWYARQPTVVNDSTFLFGTTGSADTGRLIIQLQAPGKALGRTLVLDDLTLTGEPAILETGRNLYWDGGFEVAASTAEYSWWVKEPEKMEIVTGDAHAGRKFFRVRGEGTYIVFPSVPVQPRRVYRLRFWVRGAGGMVHPGMHKLAPTDWETMRIDTAARVGWAEPVDTQVRLDSTWRCIEWEAACEGREVVWFQPTLVLRGPSVEIDDLECISIGPPPAAKAAGR